MSNGVLPPLSENNFDMIVVWSRNYIQTSRGYHQNNEPISKNSLIFMTLYTRVPVGLVVREGGHDPEVNLREGHLLVRTAPMQNVKSTVVNSLFPSRTPRPHQPSINCALYLELMAIVIRAI